MSSIEISIATLSILAVVYYFVKKVRKARKKKAEEIRIKQIESELIPVANSLKSKFDNAFIAYRRFIGENLEKDFTRGICKAYLEIDDMLDSIEKHTAEEIELLNKKNELFLDITKVRTSIFLIDNATELAKLICELEVQRAKLYKFIVIMSCLYKQINLTKDIDVDVKSSKQFMEIVWNVGDTISEYEAERILNYSKYGDIVNRIFKPELKSLFVNMTKALNIPELDKIRDDFVAIKSNIVT